MGQNLGDCSMRFDSFDAFLQMGGHGTYVWVAYLMTLTVLFMCFWWPRVTRQRIIREEKRAVERQGGNTT